MIEKKRYQGYAIVYQEGFGYHPVVYDSDQKSIFRDDQKDRSLVDGTPIIYGRWLKNPRRSLREICSVARAEFTRGRAKSSATTRKFPVSTQHGRFS